MVPAMPPNVRPSDLAPAPFETADENLAEMLDSLSGADHYLDYLTSLFLPFVGDRVLEVGSGHGDIAERLVGSASVTATDFSDRCLSELRGKFDDEPRVAIRRLDALQPDITGQLPQGEHHDTLVMANVLEHLPDHADVLANLATAIEPGGHMIVFVPAYTMLYGRFDNLIGHQRRYRKATLHSAFHRAGLDTVQIRYVNTPGWFAWLLTVRIAGQIPTDQRMVRLYDRTVVPILQRVEATRHPPFGQSVLGIARVRSRS